MRRFFLIAFALLLGGGVRGRVPGVYEFCSYVLGEKGSDIADSSCDQCQSIPGKRGPIGIPGLRGPKGDQGREGKCEELERRIARLEVMTGCTLGMKSRDIQDSQITTSSEVNASHGGKFGRLDERQRAGNAGAWCVQTNDVNQWIQVDLLSPKTIVGFITQGRENYGQWAKSYKIGCGNSAGGLITVTQDGIEKIFTANTDNRSKVYNWLPTAMTCRYIRLYPETWTGHICIRMEILGECQ